MKINWKLVRNVPLALAVLIPLAACEQQGPAEQAGEQVDETMEQAAEQAEGAAEQAGQEMEEAAESMGGGNQ